MIFCNKQIVFLTYGDFRFEESRKRIIEEAKATNIFTDCVLETESIVYDLEFHSALKDPKFREVFNIVKGGGCYIWKPYIIHKHLRRLKENDLLIYADAG